MAPKGQGLKTVRAPKPHRTEEQMKKETTYIRKAAEVWPELKAMLPAILQDLSLETNYEKWREADTAIAMHLTPKWV